MHREGDEDSMLPGFRFLFATVVLSVSVLVFALGAAALLRAAHEDFASLPAAHAREAKVAQERDARQATLALLRVEMIADQDTNVEKMAAASAAAEHASEPTEAATSSAPTPVASVPDVAAPVAVLSTEATAAPVAVMATEPPAIDAPTVVAAVTARPQPDAQAPVASAPPQAVLPQPDVKVAALADPAAASAEVATTPPTTAVSKPIAKTDVKAASKAATPTAAKPDKAKRAAIARRKAVSRSRARAAAQVTQQQMQPSDPFAGFGNQRTASFPR